MLAETKERAVRNLDPILRSYLPHLLGDSPILAAAGISHQRLLKESRDTGRLPRGVIEKLAATGTAKEILEQVELMLKAGVDHVCFGHPLSSEPTVAMRTLAQRVLPHFN